MAMTIEEKISKKGQGKELKYKKGLAITFLRIEETASEYKADTEFKVLLSFQTKAAVNRASKFLGYKLAKKETVAKFERGIKEFQVRLTAYEVFELEGQINIKRGFNFTYQNDYTSERYSILIDPRMKELTNEIAGYNTGSTADGEPLQGYVDHVKSAILSGSYHYIA